MKASPCWPLLLLLSSPSECFAVESILKSKSLTFGRLRRSSVTGLATDPPAAARPTRPALRGTTALMAAAGAGTDGGDTSERGRFTRWFIANRSILLLLLLVVHKSASDGLTRWTRLQTSYSGNTVAVMSEVAKFPLIALAITTFGGGASTIGPVFRDAFVKKPFSNAWLGLCYTFNNLLYFDALTALSAVAYQVLSQSKTLFTAGLMYFIVGKRLVMRQVLAIALLIAGALLVQVQELARMGAGAAAGVGGAAASAMWWGVGLTLFSSFISALPNVYYEKVLKTEGENQWVNNIQVTIWIMTWVSLASLLPLMRSAFASVLAGGAGAGLAALPAKLSPAALGGAIAGIPAATKAAFTGFTLPVWGVVLLKAFNGILIPATFK